MARLGETLWFLPATTDFPAQFTGAVADKLRLRHLAFAGGVGGSATAFGAAAFQPSETLIFTNSTTSKMLAQHNGVWSVHTIPAGVGPYVSSVADGGVAVNDGSLILCDGGGVGVAAKFYSWRPTIDRPGKVGDTDAQPGDGSTTPLVANFAVPERWSRDGKEFTVRSVTVDFVKWNTGATATNHIDVTVRSLYRHGVASHKDSAVKSWDEAPSATTADKTSDRHIFNFGDQGPAHGFQIRFDALRGVAIRRFIVQVDVTDARRP